MSARLTLARDTWLGHVRSRDVLGHLNYSSPRYWVVGAAFVAVYLAVERATFVYQLDGLGITLWGPSAGLSVAFLIAAGLSFAPFVFVASLISDYIIYLGPRGVFAPVGTSIVLMVGFSAIAVLLKRNSLLSARPKLRDVLGFLLLVSIGTAVIALLYCSVLFAAGSLSSWRFLVAARNFWIGDTVGIITIIPVAGVLLSNPLSSIFSVRPSAIASVAALGAVIGLTLWLIFGLEAANEYQFFYLFFLPVIWIAVRWGYPPVTLALLGIHVLIVSTASTLSYAAYDFIAFQMLMAVLSGTGLLLGVAIQEGRCAEELLRAQQLDLARAARRAIVGATGTAIAHEISQPLASATNYLHAARRLLRNNGEGPTPATVALDNAVAEAQRARETLERVRDYVSSGRLRLTQVDIEQAAHKIANLVSREARAQRVGIDVHCSNYLPTIHCDRVQVEQVLFNLLSNAVDAAGQAGEGGAVKVRVGQRRDRVVLLVEDNGSGIAPEMARHLFEPFETSKPTGMGMGLAVVRQIVEAHAGEIHWENVVPRGARFTVELPVDGPRQ